MSFGFSVGDFVSVGQLAWTLYRDCYMVARGAPQEFQLLLNEIQTLHGSLKILQDEIGNPESVLVLGGENRVRMVNDVVSQITTTLTSLSKMAKKHKLLGSDASKRKQLWARISWSIELSNINKLRSKLVYHNTVLNLLLTCVGNSSLTRMESATKVIDANVTEIKRYIQDSAQLRSGLSSEVPTISAISDAGDGTYLATISATLMKNAEASQPLSSIGIDRWIQAGRWWLLKSQMGLYTSSTPGQTVTVEVYVSLIKASWILVDIAAQHPQLPFLDSATRYELQLLSAEVKQELKRISDLKLVVPDLSEVEEHHLEVWESRPRSPLLLPSKMPGGGQSFGNIWAVKGEHVYFQRFALYHRRGLPDSLPCMALLTMQDTTGLTRLAIQDQNGASLMEIAVDHELDVQLAESSVIFNVEEVKFPTQKDAICLYTTLEGINFYLSTKYDYVDHDDVKGFILIFAVKNSCYDMIMSWLGISKEKIQPENSTKALSVALTLTSQFTMQLGEDGLLRTSKVDCIPKDIVFWAAIYELESVFRLLMQHGVSVESEYSQLVHHWLESKVMLDYHFNDPEMTTLHKAARCGHGAVALLLLEHGADVNAPGPENGGTPLHQAAAGGHGHVVQLLLENGANADALARPSNSGTLHHAATGGNRQAMELILRNLKAVGIDQADKHSQTALHLAAAAGHKDLVQLLLDKGALVGRKASRNDGEPIHFAAAQGHVDVVRLLLARGASVHAIDGLGRTPLFSAARPGHESVVRLLLENGADANQKATTRRIRGVMQYGATPLHHAVAGWHTGVVLILIQHGADVNTRDDDGGTPLDNVLEQVGHGPRSLEANKRAREMVDLLMRNGATRKPKTMVFRG